MNHLKKLLCLLLCMLLCFSLPVQANAAANSASSSKSSTEQPAQTIRVCLKRLALTDRADLILDGLYSVKGDNGAELGLPRGSSIVIQLHGSKLYLYYSGASICLGSGCTLSRTQTTTLAKDGMRFSKGGNLYPGDLRLSINGGVLVPVLTISVEDYLLGVVPYEMSNSFPLEALKAQAVCARTYALSHVKESAAWDVVDTTNDQVFRGVNYSHTNAILAVQETAGLVGTRNGQLITCYYSASNGGQTVLPEHMWGGTSNGVYAVTDDPYDLENPESIVRTFQLRKNASNLPEALTAFIHEAAVKQIVKAGYDEAIENFVVESIDGLSLSGGILPEPSRYMNSVTLTVTWSGKKWLTPATGDGEDYSLAAVLGTATAAPTVTPEKANEPYLSSWITAQQPLQVTLKLFSGVTAALNLTISDTTYPMITVEETDNAFILRARRYGHGVGMSQRGAQWMAGKYGKTFREILSFYYPGMELTQTASGQVPAPTPQAQLFNTPAPAASPTPRPTLMPVTEALPKDAWLASVEKIDDDSTLNLRSEPTTACDIVMRLYKHQQLVVLELCNDNEWAHVRTDVIEGYVMVSFLEPVTADGLIISEETAAPSVTPSVR